MSAPKLTEVFTASDLALFRALIGHGVRFMLVGQSAAVLQGSRGSTEDVDVWFEDVSDTRIAEAITSVGGYWASGSFGLMPPQLGGGGISDFFDVVVHCDGLRRFAEEYADAREVDLGGVRVPVLPLERILASKRAAGRPKDLAQIPALEAAIVVSRDLESES